jgi:hypothetical protein
MHTHQSLFKDGENAFFDPKGAYQLSTIAHHYLGGLLRHARGMSAITNPLVNSYKRLVPGFEAPVNVAWSMRNRSPLIRVPARRGTGTRVELRSPDPAANPYLALAVMLAAGLDGIVTEAKVELLAAFLKLSDQRLYGVFSLTSPAADALDDSFLIATHESGSRGLASRKLAASVEDAFEIPIIEIRILISVLAFSTSIVFFKGAGHARGRKGQSAFGDDPGFVFTQTSLFFDVLEFF